MARIRRLKEAPNVLLVVGSDVAPRSGDDYRPRLRDVLYAAGAGRSRVSRGTHDFWITYPIPAPEGPSNFAYGDADTAAEPRPLRGIIQINEPPSRSDADALHAHLRTLLHEVGHYWLVPHDLRFRTGGGVLAPEPTGDLVARINRGGSRPGARRTPRAAAILGRDDVHWSAYLQAEHSPMDGQHYAVLPDEDGFAHWRHLATVQQPLSVVDAGAPVPAEGLRYSGLDLAIMGALRPAEAFPNDPLARMRWIDPRLTAPLDYHVGICVAFAPRDFIYFGFYRDHRTLMVQRTGGAGSHPPVSLGADYRPLATDGPNGVALRVVRRGDQYHFQARYDTGADDPAKERIDGLFDDLAHLPDAGAGGDFRAFRTIARLQSADPPRAIGLIVKKWDHPHLVEGQFFNLEVQHAGRRTRYRFLRPPSRITRLDPDFAQLPSGAPRLHTPGTGSFAVVRGRRLRLVAPFSTPKAEGGFVHHDHFDHWSHVDRAPKVLLRAPEGDFAFGTSAKVARTVFTPWAGGYAAGRELWGTARSATVRGLVVPERIRDRQAPPRGNAYRFAFIVVAERAGDVDHQLLERLETVREHWQHVFPFATRGKREALSHL